MRTHTPVRRGAGTSTIHTVQRCCNGCGRTIGDVTEEELFAEQLPDVRHECPWCAPFLAEAAGS